MGHVASPLMLVEVSSADGEGNLCRTKAHTVHTGCKRNLTNKLIPALVPSEEQEQRENKSRNHNGLTIDTRKRGITPGQIFCT